MQRKFGIPWNKRRVVMMVAEKTIWWKNEWSFKWL